MRALTVGAAPGGRRAAALFPRPRHRRGGVPGGLPARAEELAAERPAARSRRLADLRRPQRRPRRRAPPRPSSAALPDEDGISDLDDAEARLAERLDGAHYRDDILRLLFICCHPELPATQQIALALRIVSRPVGQADRARLPGQRGGDGAAHHPRQGAASPSAERALRDAGRARAGRAARRRGGDDLPAVQRGLFGERRRAPHARAPLCEEAIRLARLLLRLFPTSPRSWACWR